MKIFKLDEHDNENLLAEIEKILRDGGVAIVPTDTVYGIVCDGLNEQAKKMIFEIKGRSESKTLIGFIDTTEKVKKFATASADKMPLMEKEWPGATTFILQGKTYIRLMTAENGRIAFRIPAHKFLLGIIKRFDILASTSANISGEKTPRSLEEIPDVLKNKVDIVIDGGITPGKPSDIWDITGKVSIQLR